MNNEIFDKIVEDFKKLYDLKIKAQTDPNYSFEKVMELLELGIEHDSFPWIAYYNYIHIIIPKLDDINIEWCKKYHEDVVNHPTEGAPLSLCVFVAIKMSQQ